jgi:LysR family glycine cleavage system transcriptional activator
MDWRDIPSLSALRAFEAAARLRSYSEAARSLNVTHAAIAQHVRKLEADLGQSLMLRAGRGVEATDAGHALARDLAAGFGEIADGVRRARHVGDAGPVSVTTTQGFAENWLMPRMGQFWSAHPGVTVAIAVDNAVVDLGRSPHHLAIRFGRGVWGGTQAEFLTDGQSVIVGTPDLIARAAPGAGLETAEARRALTEAPWVIDMAYAELFPWLREHGIDPEALNRTELPSNSLVLAACRAGAGLSVQSRAVVERDLNEGTLVALSQETDQPDLGYYIVRGTRPVSDDLRLFLRWLRSTA